MGAKPSSNRAAPQFSCEERAALLWALARKEREPARLSLWIKRWDAGKKKVVENPSAEHVRVLWRMDRDKRLYVWRTLGRHEVVKALELGGDHDCPCPMDVEELFLLLPRGQRAGALAGLRVLLLWKCTSEVSDGFLHALAAAGCGYRVTSLSLWGAELGAGVTDEGLGALALAGCGSRLTSLELSALKGLTDKGLCALAAAGCGARLAWLDLSALGKGVTDAGLASLAAAGSGIRLKSLSLRALKEGVTDAGLLALASAGCGARLTSLTLSWLKEGVTNQGLTALTQAGNACGLTSFRLALLKAGVTDEGLRAVAAAGGGASLTELTLHDDEGITSNSFGAALGLPREFHNAERFSPQEVYQQWKLVQDQWHFLKEKGQKLCSPSRAVQDWDTQHSSADVPMCRRVFAWEPSTEERVLLWMLPLEVWQQVLGFCPFEEYARLVGLRGGGDKGERSLCWWSSRTASREFYLVLKHSLLEMRFDRVLPSAWLGGLWQASRTWEGKHIKTLRLEGTKNLTPSVLRLIDEVVPLTFLRELHVVEGGVDTKAEIEKS